MNQACLRRCRWLSRRNGQRPRRYAPPAHPRTSHSSCTGRGFLAQRDQTKTPHPRYAVSEICSPYVHRVPSVSQERARSAAPACYSTANRGCATHTRQTFLTLASAHKSHISVPQSAFHPRRGRCSARVETRHSFSYQKSLGKRGAISHDSTDW